MKFAPSCKEDLTIGIDTSGTLVSVAIIKGSKLLIQKEEPKNFGEDRLFPLIHEIFEAKSLTWKLINKIGVCVGPGNFNGIRVGVSAARGLAMSLGIPALGITKFDAVAFQHSDPLLITIKSVKNTFFARIGSLGQPFVSDIDNLELPKLKNLAVIGHEAEAISKRFGINFLKPHYSSSHAVSIIASGKVYKVSAPPTPYYVNPPRIDQNKQ